MAEPKGTIRALDHLVLTVSNLDATLRFYGDILGLEVMHFDGDRFALRLGMMKLNLHPPAAPFQPKAASPTPGAIDLCVLTETPVEDWVTHLEQHEIEVIEGPAARTGARHMLRSIYCRDPDGNLIEIANEQVTA